MPRGANGRDSSRASYGSRQELGGRLHIVNTPLSDIRQAWWRDPLKLAPEIPVAIDGEAAQPERGRQIRRIRERKQRDGVDRRSDLVSKDRVEHHLGGGIGSGDERADLQRIACEPGNSTSPRIAPGVVDDDDAGDSAKLPALFNLVPILRAVPFERGSPPLDFRRVQRRHAPGRQRAPVDRSQSRRCFRYHCSIRCLKRSTSPSMCADAPAADAFAARIVS